MRTTSTRRAGALATAAAIVQLASVPAASGTEVTNGARRTVYYEDNFCRLEAFREYAYNARAVDTNGTVARVDFGECYPRGSTGAITTCDVESGVSSVETFLDSECKQHIYSSSDSPYCENLKLNGQTCPAGSAASASTDCTSLSPYENLNPGTFNLVGSPYQDSMCEHRLGGDHIVPGYAFGVGNAACSESSLVRGSLFSLSECLDDGSVYAKVYGADDRRCSGNLIVEVLLFPDAGSSSRSGGICALGRFDDGRNEYYRLNACTTADETPVGPVGPTPAPTVAPPTATREPMGPPIDYRGDGDDEDLREGGYGSSSWTHPGTDGRTGGGGRDHSDDDSGANDSDDDSGDGHSKDDDSGDDTRDQQDTNDPSDDNSGRSSDDSSSSRRHRGPDHDSSDDDEGSEEDSSSVDDDDNNTNPSGNGGEKSGSGGAGGDSGGDSDDLDDNAIFAIVFGVTTGLLICILSAILALSGNPRAKIGPKG